jgi:hypothetical protein
MRTKGIIVSSEQVATFTDFETRYLTLTLDQKTIVLLMAFMGNTPTRARLVNCLRRLDLNNSAGRRYTSKEVGTIWTRLSAAGLLTHENKLKLPHIYAAHFRAGAEKRLVELGSVAAREFEANSPQHSLQQFRLAMFTHDLDMVRKLYRVCCSSGFWPVKEAQSCMPPSHWEKFAPDLLRELDFFNFGELLQGWAPSPELFASLASDTVAHSALSAEQACLLTVYALLLGDAKLAQEIADRSAPGYSHAQAMCRFFRGDYDGAHTDFKQAYGDAMRFGVERLDIVDAAFALSTLAAGKSYSSASKKRTERLKPLYSGFTD